MRRAPSPARGVASHADVFKTSAGWCVAIHDGNGVVSRLHLPTTREKAVRHARGLPAKKMPALERLVRDYFSGKKTSFASVRCALEGCPPFHRAAYAALRAVQYGAVVTYAALAAMAGRPGASRAAGSAMARNPVPLVIPCHRVVRSDGGLGNFSADAGPALKARMLSMEASVARGKKARRR